MGESETSGKIRSENNFKMFHKVQKQVFIDIFIICIEN